MMIQKPNADSNKADTIALATKSLILSFLFGFVILVAVPAFANAWSNPVRFSSTWSECSAMHASTLTGGGLGIRSSTITASSASAASDPGCNSPWSVNVPTGYIGANAALRKSDGTVCSNASTTYNQSTGSWHTRVAFKTSACTGTMFSGSGTGYYYSGSGYISKSAQAPYQNG